MPQADIRRLDLDLLMVLDALHKERSVTRAAARLALTQPTVSGRLKRLREVFGDELYLRTSHGVVPTPRAEALAPRVAEILEAAGALLAPERFDPATTAFSVTLCGSDYLLQTVLGALAGEVLTSAPHARVKLLARPTGTAADPDAEVESRLARGEIDLLVSMGDAALPELPRLTLYEDGLVCVSSYAAHAPDRPTPLEELCTLRHVILGGTRAPLRRWIDGRLAARGLARDVALEVPNFATLFQAMRHGELVAFLPTTIAALNADAHVVLRTALDVPAAEIVANWHPRMTGDARHAWLRGKLAAHARRPSRPPASAAMPAAGAARGA